MYGIRLPDGLRNNEKLHEAIITPTSKALDGGHDEPLSRNEILAQGLLTDRYLESIPADSRAASEHGFLQESAVTPQLRAQLHALQSIARQRGQSIAQLALAWVLRHKAVTSALVGVSRVEQLEQNVATLDRLNLSEAEIAWIDDALATPAQ